MRIDRSAAFQLTVERSRFYAVLIPADGEADVLQMVRRHKGEYRKANHHCWAFRRRGKGGLLVEKSRDDGEVGHPGRILLDLLRFEDLEGGVLVSRIFGGVKLGVGGVARAFRAAGAGAVGEFRQKKSPT